MAICGAMDVLFGDEAVYIDQVESQAEAYYHQEDRKRQVGKLIDGLKKHRCS